MDHPSFEQPSRLDRCHVEGEEPLTPFVLAYRALEANDRERLVELLDSHSDLVHQRGTNGNDLLGMAGDLEIVSLLLERGADPNRGNDYGWTKLHQAGYGNDCDLARVMLAVGGRTDLFARGDGGTPLVAALFWGHREVAELLGREPGNLRVAAGLGDLELIRELAGTAQAGAHRGFYRPHGGFPAWQPSDEPQEILDEALVWAAKSDRAEAIRLLVELGARVDADPYRGHRVDLGGGERPRSLDPNSRRAGRRPEPARELRRAEPRRGRHGDPPGRAVGTARGGGRAARAGSGSRSIQDRLRGGTALGWARVGGHEDLADILP